MGMELPGKRKRGRPKRRFLDVMKEDMGKVGAREKDIENRTLWRNIIRCATPDQRERPKEEEAERWEFETEFAGEIFVVLLGKVLHKKF